LKICKKIEKICKKIEKICKNIENRKNPNLKNIWKPFSWHISGIGGLAGIMEKIK